MIKVLLMIISFIIVCILKASADEAFEKDTIKTSSGDLDITFIGHASLILKFADRTIYVDPFGDLTDYSKLPKADLIIVTHEHHDHFDLNALNSVRTKNTVVIVTPKCADKLFGALVMKNGNSDTIMGIKIESVPAYNIVNKRGDGNPFHPKGEGNGYIFTFGDKRLYIAGDTENTPEMKALKNIDIAFLPMNLPFTMTPEMVADAAKAFNPRVLYPYHYGDTDPSALQNLLKGSNIDVRIRKMR